LGVSLEVAFKGVGWLYGYEVKTSYSTIGQTKDGSVRLTSAYFSDIEKAKAWLTDLTLEMEAIEKAQKVRAQEFEKAVCGKREI